MSSFDLTTRLLAGLAVLLGLSRGAGSLATRFGQPAVLAEIAVGVALGPSVLGRLLPGVHRQLFGQEVQSVLNGLAQLAVALYAFEIGRHLVDRDQRPGTGAGTGNGTTGRGAGGTAASPGLAGRRAPLVLAAASLLAPAAAGVALAPLLHGRGLAGAGIGLGAFALFLACSFAVTAVPVLARILQDRGLEQSAVGRLSLQAASIGDAVCWCLLGLALCLAGRTGWPQLLAGLLGAGLAAVLAHRRARRPAAAGGREAGAGRAAGAGREAGVVAVSGAVCLAAATSSALGLHPLFGGLVLGLAWPRTSPSISSLGAGSPTGSPAGSPGAGSPGARSVAVTSLTVSSPSVKSMPEGSSTRPPQRDAPVIGQLAAVLLPCFFLGTGQQVDLGVGVLDGGFPLLVAGLLAVATASKFAACALVGARYGCPPRDALRLGVLMNTRGLTEIVVLTTGYQAGLIGHRLFEALLVVALLATAAAGPALSLLAPRPVPLPGRPGAARPAPLP
ncbi:cation:proton antiporter [Kitasatospora sp. NBC_01287]|uniref:cation:proton antiporter n=1 Tax=Kitasatospora sp. NBC_01287 TaxID=2903573 RepID=UPI0022526DE8|nr:cation:proton antiporter [Kitasatospora sp. NBC_01287]MCX4748325.1 cation:proton antiporter [Kitasatospora sp. NBC_01287]